MQRNQLALSLIAVLIVAARESSCTITPAISGECGSEVFGEICSQKSRRLQFIGAPLLRAGFRGANLVRRSFLPPTVTSPTLVGQPTTGAAFGPGLGAPVTEPVTGITFMTGLTSGRFFPIDPLTGRVLSPPPQIQQDPLTGQSFIIVAGQVIPVDPVLGRPLSLSTVGVGTNLNSPANQLGVSLFGSGSTTSAIDPVTGITFVTDPTSGRFFPIDPTTNRILSPPPIIQQDPATGQSFIDVLGQAILVDPVTGRPLTLTGVDTAGLTTAFTSPGNLQLGRKLIPLPVVAYREGTQDGDIAVRVGNAIYNENPFTGRFFYFGG